MTFSMPRAFLINMPFNIAINVCIMHASKKARANTTCSHAIWQSWQMSQGLLGGGLETPCWQRGGLDGYRGGMRTLKGTVSSPTTTSSASKTPSNAQSDETLQWQMNNQYKNDRRKVTQPGLYHNFTLISACLVPVTDGVPQGSLFRSTLNLISSLQQCE